VITALAKNAINIAAAKNSDVMIMRLSSLEGAQKPDWHRGQAIPDTSPIGNSTGKPHAGHDDRTTEF
jgi:hypothetical protein